MPRYTRLHRPTGRCQRGQRSHSAAERTRGHASDGSSTAHSFEFRWFCTAASALSALLRGGSRSTEPIMEITLPSTAWAPVTLVCIRVKLSTRVPGRWTLICLSQVNRLLVNWYKWFVTLTWLTLGLGLLVEYSQWRRSCGGPTVLTPSLTVSRGSKCARTSHF